MLPLTSLAAGRRGPAAGEVLQGTVRVGGHTYQEAGCGVAVADNKKYY